MSKSSKSFKPVLKRLSTKTGSSTCPSVIHGTVLIAGVIELDVLKKQSRDYYFLFGRDSKKNKYTLLTRRSRYRALLYCLAVCLCHVASRSCHVLCHISATSTIHIALCILFGI
jgi:hypothetical protein